MMVSAVVLGIIAVVLVRFLLAPRGPAAAKPAATVAVVAAANPFSFGDKVSPATLKLVDLPADAVPAGAFRTIGAAVDDGRRVAQRAIGANEILVPAAISGTGSRLSTMGVIGPSMRAISVVVSEPTSVGGLIAPGDHVDIYVTRTPPDKAARYDVVVGPTGDAPKNAPRPIALGEAPARGGPRASGPAAAPAATTGPATLVRATQLEGARPTPITDLLVQNVRVLAIGQNTNVTSDKPELVKSATLEVTPAQVAKLTLGQSVGTLTLALRQLSDDDLTTVASLHVDDLHDAPTRIAAVARPVKRARVRRAAPRAPAPSVEIVRGGTSTTYAVHGS